MNTQAEKIMKALQKATVSPYREMLAYEALWGEPGMTEKTLAELFAKYPRCLPSHVLWMYVEEDTGRYDAMTRKIEKAIASRSKDFSVSFHGDTQYPSGLRDAKYPVEILYYIGEIDLTVMPCISVVGSRKVSEEGKIRTKKIVQALIEKDYVIVSGLAYGVDTVAHTTCIEHRGRTIAVIGTPIDQCYPKENKAIFDIIKERHLLISQVPFFYYQQSGWQTKRTFFPKRNVTMAALSLATIIVEAGQTSGTETQARACIQQGRKLFILNNVFDRPGVKWPHLYEERGAIRVKTLDDIFDHLPDAEQSFDEYFHLTNLDLLYQKLYNEARISRSPMENN